MSSRYDFKFKLGRIEEFETNYYVAENSRIVYKKIYPPHVDDFIEFYMLFEGDASFSVENHVYKLAPGDVVVSKPNQIHNCIINSSSTHKHACFWFKVNENDFIFKRFLEMQAQVITPTYDNAIKLQQTVRQLKNISKTGNELSKYSLLIALLDILSNSAEQDATEQNIPAILKDILNDLNDNFININSLEYFIRKYSVSSSTLNRLFNEHLNTSPKLFLETKRLAHSRKLLRDGYSVMSACVQSGFPDYSNYIRLFKKRFGITPKQYKDRK